MRNKFFSMILSIFFVFAIVGCGNIDLESTIHDTLNSESNYVETYSVVFTEGNKDSIEIFVVVKDKNVDNIVRKIDELGEDVYKEYVDAKINIQIDENGEYKNLIILDK